MRSLVLAAILVTGCQAVAIDLWPAWSGTVTRVYALADQINTASTEVVAGIAIPAGVNGQRHIADLSDEARTLLISAKPPLDAAPFKAQLIDAFGERGRIALDRIAGPSVPFSFCADAVQSANCVAERRWSSDMAARETSWKKEFDSLRRRYELWLVSQGR